MGSRAPLGSLSAEEPKGRQTTATLTHAIHDAIALFLVRAEMRKPAEE